MRTNVYISAPSIDGLEYAVPLAQVEEVHRSAS